jgi:hypothetical protein
MRNETKENGFGLYDGRALKPLLLQIAREKGMTYNEVKEAFIKKIAKPDAKMRHNHSRHKIIERSGVKVAECLCGARKVLIEGIPTNWIEGSYIKRDRKESKSD